MQSSKRFDVALSFPGECRNFVKQTAEALAKRLDFQRVFYDQWYEAELARPNLDIYLQSIYHDNAELVVIFLCAEYEKKDWCGLEWRAVRNLLKQKQDAAIMPIRFDNAPIPGLYGIDGYIDASNRSPETVANLILERLKIYQRSHSVQTTHLGTKSVIIQHSIASDNLSSDRNISYTRLRDLLKAGKWKESDQETNDRMLEVMGRQEEGWLRVEDIEQFPCTDLRTIDRLWVKYSNGTFGFSVQKQIWQAVKGDFESFRDCVGWRENILTNVPVRICDVSTQYTISAPKGHLPIKFGASLSNSLASAYMQGVWGNRISQSESFWLAKKVAISSLASRLSACDN